MAQEEPLEPGAPPPEESSNRMFIILALLLGGIFLVGLICIGAYAVFLGPQQIRARQTQVAVVNGTNTQIVAGNTQVAADMTRSAEQAAQTQAALDATATVAALPPSPTASSSPTPVVAATATNTPPPTNTLSLADLTKVAETQHPSGGDITTTPATPTTAAATTTGTPPTNTPTSKPGTPTKVPSRTPSPVFIVVTTTGTPGTSVPGPTVTKSPTALPRTGFGDSANVPGLLGLGLVLLAVIVIARRVRLSLR